jgi:hypothetical protein
VVDPHLQGVQFYAQQTLTRWFNRASEAPADPIWKEKALGGS